MDPGVPVPDPGAAAVKPSWYPRRATERRSASARRVAYAWLGHGRYGRAEQDERVTAFAIGLDTRDAFPPVGDTRLNAANCTEEVKAVAERRDDDELDAIAHLVPRQRGGPTARAEHRWGEHRRRGPSCW